MIMNCNRTQGLVIDTITTLSKSNGFYCRLWNWLYNAIKNGEDLTDFWAQFKNCKNSLDVIFTLEQ